jgi:hypothetical protein
MDEDRLAAVTLRGGGLTTPSPVWQIAFDVTGPPRAPINAIEAATAVDNATTPT